MAGVRVAIVKVREFEDGELVEHTADYFAQDGKGRVWYFGERVDDIENGKVVGHEGQWLAGENGAKPGLFMPAKPRVGQVFEQERAPGVAEDRSKVVAVGRELTTPAGTFDDCIKTRDFAPLDRATEFKFYCAGVGLVREKPPDGRLNWSAIEVTKAIPPASAWASSCCSRWLHGLLGARSARRPRSPPRRRRPTRGRSPSRSSGACCRAR